MKRFAKWLVAAGVVLMLAGGFLLLRAPTGPAPRRPPARGADGFYRDHGFHIRFPAGWALVDGVGNVVIKAVDPAVPAEMSVMVTALPAGVRDADAARLLDASKGQVEAALKAGGGKLLEAKVVPFAGSRAAYMRLEAPYAEPRGEKRAVNEQYLLVRGDVIVAVTATARAEDYERREPDLAAAALSFGFDRP